MKEIIITEEYLRQNKDHIFVFGDNLLGVGYGGAAVLRDEPNALGFITKKKPNNKDSSFYKPDEYQPVFEQELKSLTKEIENCPEKTFLISKLGAGLANKHLIWEKVIKDGLKTLKKYSNVVFLFDE